MIECNKFVRYITDKREVQDRNGPDMYKILQKRDLNVRCRTPQC